MENNKTTTFKDKWKLTAIILIIAFVLATGVAVFFAIKSNNKQSQLDSGINSGDTADNNKTTEDGVTIVDTPNISDDAQINDKEGYVAIPSWGIKIKMRDADKILITLFAHEGITQYKDSGAYYDESISYVIREDALQDKRCAVEGLGSGIIRLVNTGGLTDYRVIGDYAYAQAASPGGACEYNAEDAALQKRIFEDFVPANIEQIVPFIKK